MENTQILIIIEGQKMRDVIKQLNKHSVSLATGISYNKLRKYAIGQIKELTKEEKLLIRKYLLELAEKFC